MSGDPYAVQGHRAAVVVPVMGLAGSVSQGEERLVRERPVLAPAGPAEGIAPAVARMAWGGLTPRVPADAANSEDVPSMRAAR